MHTFTISSPRRGATLSPAFPALPYPADPPLPPRVSKRRSYEPQSISFTFKVISPPRAPFSPFFVGDNNLLENAYGYIYQRNPNGSYNLKPTGGTTNERTVTSGPWYFYFGLKKGKTAMDKFIQQYLGT